MRSSVPSEFQRQKQSFTVLRGGRSFGSDAHWQPVLRIYISPLTISRSTTVRLLPPRLACGISGAMIAHSASATLLGERSLLRSYRARFSFVPIGRLLRIGPPPWNHK